MPEKRRTNSSDELSETMAAIRKRYGGQTIKKASELTQPGRISTGVFAIDFALLGGIPHNRVTSIAGQQHSGKTTISCLIIASAQRQQPDMKCVFMDIEGTFDSVWAEALGVDLDQLHVVEPYSGEMAVDVADAIIGSRETGLFVADSIAALTPMREIESSAEDAHVAVHARLVTNFVKRVGAALVRERQRDHYVTVLLLNQFRAKIGGFVGFGEPRLLPGGKALEHVNSVQIDIKNKKENRGKDDHGLELLTHNEHAFTIKKNKLNNGPRTGEFIMVRQNNESEKLYTGDIDDAPMVLSYAKRFGLYTGGGTRWTLEVGESSYEFGKAQEAVLALREDKELFWELRTQLIRMQAETLGMPQEFIDTIE